MKSIDIILATYNGEKYLEDQINSIINQTFKEWKLLIHDDNSSDKSKEIIKKFQKKYPEKIFFFDDGIKAGGAKENFSLLLSYSKSCYIMPCDQDDIWLPNKVQNAYSRIVSLEEELGEKTPLLAYSDLTVTNENLEVIQESFQRSLFHTHEPKINWLLVQNIAPGCSMIFNRALVNKASPVPKDAIMHDWWLILVASALGKISFIDSKDILYRQHPNNTIGFKKFNAKHIIKKIINLKESKCSISNTINQATCLSKILPETHEKYETINKFSNIKKFNKIKKISFLLNKDIRKQHLIQNIGLHLFI